jgi:hypothetical protein
MRYEAELTDIFFGFCAPRQAWLYSLRLRAIGFEIEAEHIDVLTGGGPANRGSRSTV